MSDTRTARPGWVIWLRVGGIIAAIGCAVVLFGFISQSLAPIQIGQAVLFGGIGVALVSLIWRLAAGRRQEP